MATRVLLLTQWFDPEPTFKGIVFARELVRQGFEVEVVTGFPNYPGGVVYPGYRIRWMQREVIDGVHVTRLPLYPNHGRSGIKRVLNYVSFGVSSLIYGLIFARRPAVIYAYHPPLTVGVVAVLMRLVRRIPVVYDIQDMWPDTLRATKMIKNEKIINIIGGVCGWVYKRVDYITVLSPGFKKLLVERGVPSEKVEVIYNWAAESDLLRAEKKSPALKERGGPFNVIFAGNMGKAQALEYFILAAAILQKKSLNISLTFIGGGVDVDALKEQSARLCLNNVIFLPKVPMSEVGAILSSADVLAVHLRKDPLFEITIPSKIQAYMAIGKPILIGVEGDAAELVRQAKCGVAVEPENPIAIAEAIELLSTLSVDDLASMGASGANFYVKKLSLFSGAESFAKIFKKLA